MTDLLMAFAAGYFLHDAIGNAAALLRMPPGEARANLASWARFFRRGFRL